MFLQLCTIKDEICECLKFSSTLLPYSNKLHSLNVDCIPLQAGHCPVYEIKACVIMLPERD